MYSRRRFLQKTGRGVAMSALALSPATLAASSLGSEEQEEMNVIRIGIIGAENSHTRAFGKLFNIDRAFPGVEVQYVWGETEAFARDAMERGGIPNMVEDPREMMGKIDALIVDHRHAKYHLEAALPFVKEGIPTFIDKPFCYRVEAGARFLETARAHGTPVTSYSSIAHSDATLDLRAQLTELGPINQLLRSGPVELDSPYGGVFFYGVHIVQPLLYMFDRKVEKVRINQNGANSGANLIFDNGMMASLVFTTKKYGWQTFVETDQGIVELKSRVEEQDPPKNYADMVAMFRTGKEPRSHRHILEGVAVLEAMERSVESGQWERVARV